MIGELVKIKTEDHFELDGFQMMHSKSTNNAVLHFHGLAGNFYENRFVKNMSEKLVKEGYVFLTANNRGHDYITDILCEKNGEISYVKGGAAFEKFEDFVIDARSWIVYLKSLGCDNIFLQGHSSGALKVLYYQSQVKDPFVKALLLLSPSDDVGVQKRTLGVNFEKSIDEAKRMVTENKADQFMSKKFYDIPISAKTYLNMFAPGTNNVIKGSGIKCPMLSVIGSEDPYTVEGPEKLLKNLRRTTPESVLFKSKIIAEANHRYEGHEEELAEFIVEFLTKSKKLFD